MEEEEKSESFELEDSERSEEKNRPVEEPQQGGMSWKSNQVISIFGKKRSGKSMFAKVVLWPSIENCILYDLKFEHNDLANDREVYIAHNLEGVIELIETRNVKKVIYQPYDRDVEDFNKLAEFVFYRGNITLWVDELKSISTPLTCPYYLSECIRLGQIRGIGVILVSQRPAMIPSLAISEADVIVSFRLQLLIDAQKIAAVMGEVYMNELVHIPDYYFLVYDFKNVQRCAPLEISASQQVEAGTIGSNEENNDSEFEEVDPD